MKKDYDPEQEKSPPKKSPPPKKEKRPSFLGRVLVLLLTIALILGAVTLVTYRDMWDTDVLKRALTYHDLTRSETGQAASFPYRQSSSVQLYGVGSDLLVCSDSTALLYSESGTLYVEDVLSFTNPITKVAGDVALVYDNGGQRLVTYSQRMELYSITLDTTETLLNATINEKGWVATTVRDSSSKGRIVVYNANGNAVIEISLSSTFLMNAVVNPQCTQVTLLTIGLDGSNFESTLSYYPLTGTGSGESTPTATHSLGDSVVLDLCWTDEGIWCLGDSTLSLISDQKGLVSSYSFGQSYLADYSLQGEGFSSLLLSNDQWSTSSQLTTLYDDGTYHTLMIEEPVLSCSVAGSYVAVLTADTLTLYNPELEVYRTLDDTQGAQEVLMRDDGTALLLDSQTARLYVP